MLTALVLSVALQTGVVAPDTIRVPPDTIYAAPDTVYVIHKWEEPDSSMKINPQASLETMDGGTKTIGTIVGLAAAATGVYLFLDGLNNRAVNGVKLDKDGSLTATKEAVNQKMILGGALIMPGFVITAHFN